MAFAPSVALKAQVPVACDLCETVDNVDWYCTDCAETLCVTCQVSHARSKASRDHVIIPRENALRYKTENASKDGIFCEQHGGGKFELHCDYCDVMVCRKCITGDHKGHNFTDIQDVAEIRKKTFNTEVENILNNVMPKIDGNLLDINNRRQAHLEHNSALHSRIRKKKDDVITAITEWYETLEKQIEDNTENTTKALDTVEEKLKKRKDSLSSKIDEWRNRILNSTPVAVLHYLKTVRGTFNQINTIPEFDARTETFIFSPGEIKKDLLRGMLGSMASSLVEIKPRLPKVILTLGCEFGVERIFAVSPWLAYTSNTFMTYLSVVNTEKISSKRRVCFDCKVGAFYVSFERDIFVSDRNNKCIKRFGKDCSTTVFLSTAPYIPKGICVTDAGDIVIGTDSSSASSQLLRYSDQGHFKDKVEGYFGAPDYICENRNWDICVSDSLTDQVLVFNAKLQKRFGYNGHPRREKSFAPRGIACDSQGCIYICDCLNNRVEVIDVNGKFIQMFLTEDNGLYEPWGLSIDTAGRVWIGQRGKHEFLKKESTITRIIIAKYAD